MKKGRMRRIAALLRRDQKIAQLEQGASKECVGAYQRRWLGWPGKVWKCSGAIPLIILLIVGCAQLKGVEIPESFPKTMAKNDLVIIKFIDYVIDLDISLNNKTYDKRLNKIKNKAFGISWYPGESNYKIVALTKVHGMGITGRNSEGHFRSYYGSGKFSCIGGYIYYVYIEIGNEERDNGEVRLKIKKEIISDKTYDMYLKSGDKGIGLAY